MKRIISISLVIALITVSFNLMAQKVKKEDRKASSQSHAKIVYAYLGKSNRNGGQISKHEFDNYLKQGLTAKDSLGNTYKVDGFNFSYSERNLYEDSVGNLIVLTDYLTEFCPGDTVSPAIANNIYYKTKAGDTAYFENVKVILPNGGRQKAKSMKFVLTK